MSDLVVKTAVGLIANPARVLARLFVPGNEHFTDEESRATGVLGRVLALPEAAVGELLADVLARYGGRHRDLEAVLVDHYRQIVHRIPPNADVSAQRRLLIGAWFTHEYSIEAAALFNPAAVPHPDQSGLADGELRFVLSLRAVGEGHRSSIEFRSGVLGPDGAVRLDPPGPHVEAGRIVPAVHDRELFAARLAEEGADDESTRFLLSRLPPRFVAGDLYAGLTELHGQLLTRPGSNRTEAIARHLLSCAYDVEFAAESSLSERVLWPHGPSERNGMEDARFVRFTDADGTDRYLGTYTAFDGTHVVPQRIETTDFRTFSISQLAGPAAKNKGLALFPRTISGRHLAISRWDRESCSLATSPDGFVWADAGTLYRPTHGWELIQTGNCGSPIETRAGWLVFTHGVGPMREYAIGALLLDLDDPAVILGSLREPLLRPEQQEREGYVPNVVYSCGALLHGDRLLLPYGAGDARVSFAVVDVPALLGRLLTDGPPATIDANSAA
ncbi:MAG: glycoside hydrolase family 130 protein [Sporichthyaceae bacterium]